MPLASRARPSVLLAAAFVAIVLTGCSATAPAPAAAPTPTTYYGQTASAIATLIDGCSDVKSGDVGKGAASGLTSTATCMLNGRLVDINSWASADAQAGVAGVIKADKIEAYFAEGTGWTVLAQDNPEIQLQARNEAGALLKYAMDNPTQPPVDLPGEKSTAEAAARSLGGKVTHVP